MALTGTFLADFNAFVVECMKADDGMNQMRLSAAAAEKQIDKLTTDFNGQKVVTEAAAMMEAVERIGGAAKLTEAELQRVATKAAEAATKLRAMGEDVPPLMEKWAASAKQAGITTEAATKKAEGGITSMLSTMRGIGAAMGIGFGISTVVEFGKHLLQTADDLVRLSDQTGLTITEVQRLAYTAEQSGNSLDQITTATSRLQAALETVEGQKAIENLGIDFRKLREAKPYEQILQISDAFRAIPDPVERARKAYDTFGKAGTAILPTLISDMRELGAAATVSGEETTRALADAGDAMDRLKSRVTNAAVGTAGGLIMAGEQVANQGLMASMLEWVKSGGRMDVFLVKMQAMNLAAKETAEALATATGGQNLTAPADIGARATPAEIKAAAAADQVAEREFQRLKKESADAAEKLAVAQAKVNEARRGGEDILQTMNAATAAAIQRDLELGAEQSDLAIIYATSAADIGRTAAQIRAIATAMEAHKKVTQEVAAIERDYNAERMARLTTTTNAEIAAIDAWKAKTLESLQATGALNEAMAARVETIWQDKLSKVGIDWDALKDASNASLRDTYERAERTYQEMLARSSEFSTGAIQQHKALRDEAKLQFDLMTADGNKMYQEWMVREDAFAKAIERHDKARADAAGAAADTESAAMDTAIAYAQAYGVSLAEAQRALGQTTEEAGKLTGETQRGTTAASQMAVAFNQVASAVRMTAAESIEAGKALEDAYRKAGIFVGTQIATGGYQQQRRVAAASEIQGVGQTWGTGAGATSTTNTLNVNVNNAEAGDIAARLVTEMRHSGVRF